MKKENKVTLDLRKFKEIQVTGVDTKGKRFTKTYTNDMGGRMTAFGINLHRGTVWGLGITGRRTILKSVWH